MSESAIVQKSEEIEFVITADACASSSMKMLQLKGNRSNLNLEGYTVILPSICVGNAAQLACDLLIASKKLERIGTLSHPAIIPIYGPSAYQHENEKASGCEFYEGRAHEKLLVIQFRSPFIRKHIKNLHNFLADLLKPAERVIILSASFGFEKRVIESSPYAYCASEPFKKAHNQQLSTVEWKEFTGDVIFGGGNALQLFRLLNQREVPVMLMFRYMLEGDNSTDASKILSELNELCGQFLGIGAQDGNLKLIVPVSWKLLFGNDVSLAELIF